MPLHEGVVDVGVRAGDQNNIGRGDRLGRQVRDGFLYLFFVLAARHPGVVVGDLGAPRLQALNHAQGRRLPIVVDVLLVGDAQHERLRPPHRLALPVEDAGRARGHPLGHRVVHGHGRLDHGGVEAVLARLPRQVVGVERYAVAAETGAGVEGREAVGLRLGGVYYLPHVDAHAVAEHAELVDEADVDVSVGVLEDLLHLGHGRARHARHAPLEHRLVDRADELERLLADGAHHLGRVLGLVDEVARIHALGREAQVEALRPDPSSRMGRISSSVVPG